MSLSGVLTEEVAGHPAIQANMSAGSPIVLVCEHASNHIPDEFDGLGLDQSARQSHAAWDPGAAEITQRLGQILDARIVASGVSRLVYDCNRPPDATDAMPARSERFEIPGNAALDAAARADRVDRYYHPFRDALADTLSGLAAPILVTLHSFTPVFMGQRRRTDIGVLHDADARLADEMLAISSKHTDLKVERNRPYGPEDGVTHTLKEHGLSRGILNVMLEIRSDHIATAAQQDAVANLMGGWLRAALARLGVTLGAPVPC